MVYPDLSCAALLRIHIFNVDILFAIVSGCLHGIGVLVPPVLVFELGVWSLSRLMTVFINALSKADILLLYQIAERLRTADRQNPTEIVGQGNHENDMRCEDTVHDDILSSLFVAARQECVA